MKKLFLAITLALVAACSLPTGITVKNACKAKTSYYYKPGTVTLDSVTFVADSLACPK